MDIHDTVEKLLHADLEVQTLQEVELIQLRAIGRQFALKYRHSKDKESAETKHILNTLISIRKMVKKRQNIIDINLQRFEQGR